MKLFLSVTASIIALIVAATCEAYPLDGYGFTGISRLEGYRLAMEGKVRAPKQPPGALLSIDAVLLTCCKTCLALRRIAMRWRCWI
jgi:hypothetical protein